MKHKYLRELFSDRELPFPYGNDDYADFDSRDTYNMDWTLVAWLYERLRYFQDVVSQEIVMDDTLYMYGERVLIDGQETTQRQCIDRMIEDCKIILLTDECDFTTWMDYMNVVEPAKNDLFMVLSKVYWAMWW